jgi:hypothetical protein
MASMYKRGRFYWVSYWVNNRQYQKSLRTKNERVARDKLWWRVMTGMAAVKRPETARS